MAMESLRFRRGCRDNSELLCSQNYHGQANDDNPTGNHNSLLPLQQNTLKYNSANRTFMSDIQDTTMLSTRICRPHICRSKSLSEKLQKLNSQSATASFSNLYTSSIFSDYEECQSATEYETTLDEDCDLIPHPSHETRALRLNKTVSDLQTVQESWVFKAKNPLNRTAVSSKDVCLSTARKRIRGKGKLFESNVIPLSDWIIKPLVDCKGVCVEGQRQGMEDFWHSTAIVEVKKKNLVMTKSGSVYKLEGHMNKLCALENGFTKDVVRSFSRGFPHNWKDMIEQFFHNIEGSLLIHDVSLSKPRKVQKVKPKPTRKEKQTTKEKPVVKERPKPKLLKRLIDADEAEDGEKDLILSPVGLIKSETSVDKVTVTRSGRMSLPPLAGWAGQYYAMDWGSKVVKVKYSTDAVRKAIEKETKVLSCVQKRYKNMMPDLTFSSRKDSSVLNKSSSAAKPKQNRSLFSQQSKSVTTVTNSNATKKGKASILKTTSEVSVTHNVSPPNPVEKILEETAKSNGKEGNSRQKCACRSTKRKYEPFVCLVDINVSEKKGSNLSSKRNNKKTKMATSIDKRVDNLTVTPPSGKPVSKEHDSVSNGKNRTSSPDTPKSGKKNAFQTKKKDILTNTGEKQKVENKGKRRKRKFGGSSSPQVSCANDSCQENQPEPPAKRSRHSKEQSSDMSWSCEEQVTFQSALKEVNSAAQDYWSLVSNKMKTRSEAECIDFHKKCMEDKCKSKSNAQKPKARVKKPSGRARGGRIEGRKGTLKRKQQVREFLDEQNEDYEDNLCEGSPFLSKKSVFKIFDVNFDKDDSEIFGANHNIFTPVNNGKISTPGTRFKSKLASVKKTPGADADNLNDTPVSLKRRECDRYIRNFQQNRKKITKIAETEKSPLDFDLSKSFIPLPKPGKLFLQSDDVHQDEDVDLDDEKNNDFMYYWNDDN